MVGAVYQMVRWTTSAVNPCPRKSTRRRWNCVSPLVSCSLHDETRRLTTRLTVVLYRYTTAKANQDYHSISNALSYYDYETLTSSSTM